MWQEIITYIILAITFGSVLYKSVIRPLVRLFSSKNINKKTSNPICANCPMSVKCENCVFYNPRSATYRYKKEGLDYHHVSVKDLDNSDIAGVTAPEYIVH